MVRDGGRGGVRGIRIRGVVRVIDRGRIRVWVRGLGLGVRVR